VLMQVLGAPAGEGQHAGCQHILSGVYWKPSQLADDRPNGVSTAALNVHTGVCRAQRRHLDPGAVAVS